MIGASLSEPHTSESNGGFFIYIYIIYYYYYYISAVRTYSVNASSTLLTRNIAHADPCERKIENNASTLEPFHFSYTDHR